MGRETHPFRFRTDLFGFFRSFPAALFSLTRSEHRALTLCVGVASIVLLFRLIFLHLLS